MTKKEPFAISYFLGRTFFLGFGFSLLFKLLDKDAWISSLLGILLGACIIFIFQKVKRKYPLNSLIGKIVFFIFNFFIFTQILFIFETFCSSFYLIKSPNIYILLPLIFIIYRIIKNGFTTIFRVSEVLFPISIITITIVSFGLLQNFNINYFEPILMTKPMTIFEGTLYFAIYSTAPFFLLWNEENCQKLIRPYLFSAFTVLVAAIFITAVLGPNLAQIYRYPEYMTLKKIKLFNFIEKVENIVSIVWLFDLFIVLAVSGNNMKNLLPKKHQKISFISILLILFGIALYAGAHYKKELWIYHNLPMLLGIMMLLLIIVSLFSKKKESTS